MVKKILIIEDDPNVQANLAQLLDEEGFNTIVASNGKEGLEKVKINNPDLIICDVMMPGIDGYRVKEILNKADETFDIPLIFLTAKTNIKDLRQGMNLGAEDYIFKPYKTDDLLRVINQKLSMRERLIAKIVSVNKKNKFNESESLFIGIQKKITAKIKSIVYIRADNQYTVIHLTTGKIFYLRKSLSYWEKVLPESIFKRIHRSHIINIKFIEQIEKQKNNTLKVILKNIPQEFSVSRRYAANIKTNIL